MTTYKTAGTAKLSGSRTRHLMLWVELWVGKSPQRYAQPGLGFAEARFRANFRVADDTSRTRLNCPLACASTIERIGKLASEIPHFIIQPLREQMG